MNHLASKTSAAITLIQEIGESILRQPVNEPDDVYQRRLFAYQLNQAERFLRDAFITATSLPRGKTSDD